MSAALPPRPVRRLLIDPLYVPFAVVLIALLAVTGALAWLVDKVTRHDRNRVGRLAALAACYLVLDLGMVLGSFGLWLRSPLGASRDPERWRDQHTALLRAIVVRLVAAGRWTVGFELALPAPLPIRTATATPILVLARHAGPGDSFALVHLIASGLDRCPRVVLKAALQWDPGLDVLLNRLSCCFLPSRTGAGDDRTAQLADLAAGLTGGEALLLFPEGGNWTPGRHQRAVSRLRRAGRRRAAQAAAANRHVLPPRPGGTLACLDARPDADVLIVAHTGLDKLTSPGLIWRALPLRDRPMRVDWWLVPAADLPHGEDRQLAWLQAQWDRMDDWVGGHTPAVRTGEGTDRLIDTGDGI